MFKSKIGLQGIEETIDRPVLIAVVNDVKRLIGIDNDIKLFLDEQEEIDRTKDKLGNVHDLSSPRSEFIRVESTEDATDGYELSLLGRMPDTYPIYRDSEVQSKFIPVTHKRTITLNFKYYNISKSKINSITNKLRLMSTTDGMYTVHNLEYHYVLQDYLLLLISNINDLKNTITTTPATLEDYINNTFDNRVDFVNSLDGNANKANIAIREVQAGVLGYITSDLHNIKKGFEESNNSWFIEFEYKFEYEKPIALYLHYPITVYNQLIDVAFRDSFVEENEAPSLGLRTRGNQAIDDLNLTNSNIVIAPGDSFLKVPKLDRVELPKPNPYNVRVMSVMAMVDTANPTTLFYLDEIPGIEFKLPIVKLFEKEAPYIGKPYESMFYLELFNFENKVYKTEVLMTPVTEIVNGVSVVRLLLSTSVPMLVTGSYRVVFNIIQYFNSLDKAAYDRLLNNIDIIDVEIGIDPYDPNAVFTSENIKNSILELFSIPPTHEYNEFVNIAHKLEESSWEGFNTKTDKLSLSGVLK